MDDLKGLVRRHLVCRGCVQGVGFRPSVHRLAVALGLTGFVRNGPEGAVIEIEGRPEPVADFLERLPRALPPLARLDEVETSEIPPSGSLRFEVTSSESGPRARALVPPDAALCADCRREMEDPEDRRHRYPFTTCTNCGPRFSLVLTLPYDRERTSMAPFPLCRDCAREYGADDDRRFHAEPVACPACGPRLWLAEPSGATLARGDASLEAAREALTSGRIVAVKGLGGFQLCCVASDANAVLTLRRRKHRPTKPLAVMARDLEAARRLVRLDTADEALLTSPRAPILLAPRRGEAPFDGAVSGDLEDLGVMLPTTPLHVELFRGAPYDALVATSGNAKDEPIAKGNREAARRLAGIADLFLFHDRDVVRRVDDSVVRSVEGGHVIVRRSRGYVPEPIPLPERIPEPVLALGGHLQGTACLGIGREAFLSQHVGDLDTVEAREFLAEAASGLEAFLEAESRLLAVDLHPDYASTWLGERLARERHGTVVRLQHHVAHAAAVLAEHGAFPAPGATAAAIVLDGTGFGPDGAAWGGEWLLLRGDLSWERLASIEPLPLVGGERAVREPWRFATAALALAGAGDLLEHLPMAGSIDGSRLAEVAHIATRGSWPVAHGAGRLFEAAGALLGLTTVNRYEGEGAMRLESLAATHERAGDDWTEVSLDPGGGAFPVLPARQLLRQVALRAVARENPASIAAGFHATFCRLGAELARHVFSPAATTVALGGGCYVNRLLLRGLSTHLARDGRKVLVPRNVPPGDGGLAYGQVVLAGLTAARQGRD